MSNYYVLFNGQTFSGVFEQFFFYSKVFGVKNANIDLFKEKMVLRVVFYKIDVYVITNWSVSLDKHQTIGILLMVDFLRIFDLKMLHLSIFSRFLKFTSSSW